MPHPLVAPLGLAAQTPLSIGGTQLTNPTLRAGTPVPMKTSVMLTPKGKNAPADQFIEAGDAEAGMRAMSDVFKEKGGEIYRPAAE
jgi:hypothetical protein